MFKCFLVLIHINIHNRDNADTDSSINSDKDNEYDIDTPILVQSGCGHDNDKYNETHELSDKQTWEPSESQNIFQSQQMYNQKGKIIKYNN